MLRSNTSSAIGPKDELIGICPPKLFPDRSRIFRQGRENSDSERFPSKLFQDIFNCRRFQRFLTTAKCVETCDDYGYGMETSILVLLLQAIKIYITCGWRNFIILL